MAVKQRFVRLAQVAAPLVVFIGVSCIGIALGVEEKSLWEKAWGSLTAGSLGAVAGLGFFLLVGAVGWVSGPVFGAIGALGLITGGALGGMGLGNIVDIFRNPGNYKFDVTILLSALAIGVLAALTIFVFLGRKISRTEVEPLQNTLGKRDA